MRLKRNPNFKNADQETRIAIVKAAERLFAAKGIGGTTMRDITAAAKVSLSAVNYHFGSKLDLAHGLVDRLSGEVCKSRLEEFSREEAAAGGKPIELEKILRIFLRPYMEGSKRRRKLFLHIIQQIRFESTPMWRQVGAEHFDPFASRVIELIQKSLPHHHKKDVYWRYHFMVCTIFAALSDTEPENRLARLSLGVADASNEDEFSTQMIRFLLNVFEGP